MSKTPLLPVDTDNIQLNENAYFFKLKPGKNISNHLINHLFRQSIDDKSGSRKYQQITRTPFFDGNRVVARYSLDIFQFQTKPTFLKEPEQGKWEVKFGLFLVVEYTNYVAIIRKNISGIKELQKYCDSIDYEVLSHFVITQSSKFEKIISSNMNTAVNAVQQKTAEARDLKGVYSRFGASKQILNSLRIDNSGDKYNISLNTSRVNSFELKGDFNSVMFWTIDMLKLIDRAYQELPQSPFIDGFATPIQFESIIDTLSPTYLLFRFSSLKDEIENESLERCYQIEDEIEVDVDLKELIDETENLLTIEENDGELVAGDFNVRVNKKSITVGSDEFDGILLDFGNDNPISLTQYVNFGNHFIINFDSVEHVYSHRKIFKDSKLLGDTENFLGTFIAYDFLNNVQSEKGSNYTEQSTSFNADSLFGFIENELVDRNQTQFLICDDMGVEWGDFISISRDDICFYHAKFHNESFSASKLEEVFGQAAKNFGFLEIDNEKIDYRSNRWTGNYRINEIETQITRIRYPDMDENIIDRLKEATNLASSSGNLRRKIFIVINFLSKNELSDAIDRVKNGNEFDNKGVTLQILWFVNSLLSTAYELNTELRIICRP